MQPYALRSADEPAHARRGAVTAVRDHGRAVTAPASRRARRVATSLALNGAIVVGEIAGGIVAHSSALLADAGHNLADAGGLALSYGALRLVVRSPTAKRSFGFHRATIISALANVTLVLVVAVLVGAESISRLDAPGRVEGGLVAVVAGAAAVADLVAAFALLDGSRDVNMRAGALHLAGDAATSIAVLGVGLIISATGRLAVLDPVLSLAIALLVAAQGWKIGRESVDILLEASPVDVDLDNLRSTITAVPGVAEVHDLHCWSLSSEVRALSAHVVLSGHPSLEQAQLVGDRVKASIGRPFEIAHTTLELECERCVEPDEVACSIEDSTAPERAAPSS